MNFASLFLWPFHSQPIANFSIDKYCPLSNNPAPFFISLLRGAFMSVRSSVFSVLLLSLDTDLQAKFREVFAEASITVAKDAAAVGKEHSRKGFDAVFVESRPGQSGTPPGLQAVVDPARTVVIAGSRQALRQASRFLRTLGNGVKAQLNGAHLGLSFEDYISAKMEDFVKGMKKGAAKNLHPMLISAVERPLITAALRQTKGNQIRAAELLGLNRNTLRKRITDLHIPVTRPRMMRSRTT
jgi:two-component system nitrogen regulation response regulator GlnG